MRNGIPLRNLRTCALGLAVFVVALPGCRDAGLHLGDSPAQARTNADLAFAALGLRFGTVEAAPGYEELRARFARSALVPSRLFADGSVWSYGSEEMRVLQIAGRPIGSRYVLGMREGVRPPGVPGEYRRTTHLHRLGRDQYEWEVTDEVAVGQVLPDHLAAALTALYSAAETADSHSLRAAYEAELPRTTAALGRLFTLDAASSRPHPRGGATVALEATVHPQRIEPEFPHLSRFLGRYVGPTRLVLVALDGGGERWWEAGFEGDRLTLRLRVHDGSLAPLEGAPRRMPDRLRIMAEGGTRIRIFNVGVSNLVGDVVLRRDEENRAFTIFFRNEPAWHLPPLVERFIRTPLRRPFEGEGASLSFSAERSTATTLLVRRYRISVQESAIVRWFGGLGSTALGDFREGAEEEYDEFVGQVLSALRSDARELLR